MAEIEELESRVNDLERRVNSLAEVEAAFRIILSNAGVDLADPNKSPTDAAYELVDRIDELEQHVDDTNNLVRMESAQPVQPEESK